MTRHTLYAYTDGSDLDTVADELQKRFSRFISEAEWTYGVPFVVNQRHENDPSLGLDDLPDWDLGLNLDLPNPDEEPIGWFEDIERIAEFLSQLHTITGRNFIIGIVDNHCGSGEDLFYVDTDKPDLVELRMIIGVKGTCTP